MRYSVPHASYGGFSAPCRPPRSVKRKELEPQLAKAQPHHEHKTLATDIFCLIDLHLLLLDVI